MLQSVWEYLATLGHYTWAIIVGVALGAFDLIQRIRAKPLPVPRRLLYGIAAFAVFVLAPFLAYHEVRLERDELQADHDELTQERDRLVNRVDDLKARSEAQFHIELMAAAINEGQTSDTSLIFLRAAVSNRGGAPSHVSNWKIDLVERDGSVVPARVWADTILQAPEGIRVEQLRYDDLLFRRGRDTRILPGGRIIGWLFCEVAMPPPELIRRNVVVRLEVGDIYGNQYYESRRLAAMVR